MTCGIFDGRFATCHAGVVKIAEPLDRTACYGILKPHLADLDDCFQAAMRRWQTWLGQLEGSPTDVSPRTRANTLYDFIVAEVTKRFLGKNHVRVRKERGFLVVRIHDRVAMRFKKFRGKNLKTSGGNTQQALAFAGQTLELSESSIQPMTHLVAGYLLDDLEIGISKVAVTCSLFGEHMWAPIQIFSDVVVVAPHAASDTGPRPVVRSKRKKQTGESAV
jgi:hypothetical protein